ncbi:MAG: peptide ABC transporter permease [Candidatus Nephthysia bennettiae]|uniref:ABC transporter permease n=1 Tax=Candidatus Nephthysia bennettiae TaxID=3127016 RepID=A0A934K225_9BACT|nr:ABC transporter permease [Candidatus Dormibacteraeota bacterium]PZR90992.1 MAG: peptide ABC transporter permease [Candidatus Dormibacteraeota bacterium]
MAEVFVQNRLAAIGICIVLFALAFCFVAPLVYRTDQIHTNLLEVNVPPRVDHVLGTDEVGYDELGRLMYGGQLSLEVGIAAAALATAIGAIWGTIAGYAGGLPDAVMMRLVDGMMSIPSLFFLMFVASLLPHGLNRVVLILVVAAFAWLGPARLVRGETLSLRVREYVHAARVMGATGPDIVLRHIAPNAIGTIVVAATFQVADAIVTVAALSYLGLGIPPPETDWGGMLAQGTTYTLAGFWWLILPPGTAIVLTVIAINFIGDALRDAFGVRLQRR